MGAGDRVAGIAARHARVPRRWLQCSTPGGMGAGIAAWLWRPQRRFAVLNARRHGSGDRPGRCDALRERVSTVLNARRHGSGDRRVPDRPRPRGDRGVLNARRHGSGDRVSSPRVVTCSCWCSTPGGMGAGIACNTKPVTGPVLLCSTPGGMGAGIAPCWAMPASCWRCVLNARRHGSGDRQRDRDRRDRARLVLNARRHGSGEDPSRAVADRALQRGSSAQRPEAWERGSPPAPAHCTTGVGRAQRPEAWERGSPPGRELRHGAARVVLNARRHGSGDRGPVRAAPDVALRCSTPGGMGAGIATRMATELFSAVECSTPGGMGAGIAAGPRRQPLPPVDVLNARRHGSGDRPMPAVMSCVVSSRAQRPEAWERGSLPYSARVAARWMRCSTPGGMGAGIARAEATTGPHDIECSTPGGMGAGIAISPRRRSGCGRRAQRPEAWERGSPSPAKRRCRTPSMCSTPGGMGAGIARSGTDSRTASAGAQRPEAWERGSPRSDGRQRHGRGLVLNARRHGSGDRRHALACADPRRRVLNARRHGSGDRTSPTSRIPAHQAGAQRPEAWERGSRPMHWPTASGRLSAQRPEAWERGSLLLRRRARRRGLPVLNARRHGSGDRWGRGAY